MRFAERLRFHVPGSLVVLVLSWFQATLTAQLWLDDAQQRIELHRQADLSISVLDNRGNPVSGADVRVQMTRHAFGFGTAVTASRINDPSSTGATYRQKLLENFNHVVFENDLKWPAWIGLWGNGFNWNNTRRALDWLDANDLPTRGHYLSWATWSGSDAWGDSQNVSTLPQRLFDHMSQKAGTVGDRVYEWDVINHPVGWLNDTYENRVGPDFYKDIMEHARAVTPEGMPLWINEDDVIAGNSRAAGYEGIIRDLIQEGLAPDGIGFQGHFIEEWGRVSRSTPQQVYSRIDRFDELIPRLRVTEFDIDVGNNEARQGQLMHDYLTVMFSHPNIEAITLWGFWGGAHWRGENGALYRTNWTEKPSLNAYQQLVLGDWWTDEVGRSDELGQFQLRAFKGSYDVTVSVPGHDDVLVNLLVDANHELIVEIPTLTVTLGDYDGSGQVEQADLDLVLLNWGRQLSDPTTSGWINDYPVGPVDQDELDQVLLSWGVTQATIVSANVPEPPACVLIAVTVFLLGHSRQRRTGPK